MVPVFIAVLALAQTFAWEPLPDAPADPGSGAAMASVDQRLYVMRGANTSDFWCYDPEGTGWKELAAVPVGVGSGGALAAGIDSIHALAGGNLRRYDLAIDQWSDLGPAPLAIGYGASIVRVWDALFILRGGSKPEFWRYDPVSSLWSDLPPAPGNIGYGSAMVHVDGHLHVIRGNGTDDRYRYSILSGAWTVEAVLPDTVSSGGTMTCDGTILLITRGASSRTTWKLDPATNGIEPWTDLTIPAVSGTSATFHAGKIHLLIGQQATPQRLIELEPPPVEPEVEVTIDDDGPSDDRGGCASSAAGMAGLPLALIAATAGRLRRR